MTGLRRESSGVIPYVAWANSLQAASQPGEGGGARGGILSSVVSLATLSAQSATFPPTCLFCSFWVYGRAFNRVRQSIIPTLLLVWDSRYTVGWVGLVRVCGPVP